MKSIAEKIAEMTAEEKRSHIDGVEFCLDCGYAEHVSDEDIAIYNALIKERAEMQTKD